MDAIPILIGWLPRIENSRVKMSVIRSLSVPWARPAANKALVAEFIRDAPRDPTLLRRLAKKSLLKLPT